MRESQPNFPRADVRAEAATALCSNCIDDPCSCNEGDEATIDTPIEASPPRLRYAVILVANLPRATFATPGDARAYCNGLSRSAFVWDYEARTITHRNY